jgi:DNA-binding SARP family transcriptional activator
VKPAAIPYLALVSAKGPTPTTVPEAPVRLRLSLLGQMTATDADGRSVLPRVRKTRAVLAVLALAAPKPVLRVRLTELLWSTRDREQARASLRQAVHELQMLLQPIDVALLRADRTQVALANDGIWIDAQAVVRATASRPEALGLMRGALLEDLANLDDAFDRWLATERRRVLAGAVTVIEAMLDLPGEPTTAIAAAERLLAIDAAHEGASRALMSAHLLRGDRAGAAEAYERCRGALAHSGQAEPAPETRALLASAHANAKSAPEPPQTASHEGTGECGVRLGVMPFRTLDAPGDDSLSLGLAEEITTALSRFRSIFLIASPSLAVLAGEPTNGSERWRRLHLDFLLDGTVQRGRGVVRVTVRLLDLRAGGSVVWSRRFDRDAGDILTLQDEIAGETVAQMDPQLLLHEGRRAAACPPHDVTAYNLMLRAIPALYRLEEASFRSAGQALADAVALDPNHAAAHAWFAYWHVFLVGQGWAADPEAAMTMAGTVAERAIALDPTDARALTITGHVRAFLHQRVDEALRLHDQALSLNPNLSLAWVMSGLAHAYSGNHDEAVRRINHARRLSPFDPHGFFFDMALTVPHLHRDEFDTVVELARRVTTTHPSLSTTYKGYLSALGHLGRTEEASSVLARLLQVEPGFRVKDALARSPLRRQEDRERYATGLRLAGLAE